ncbi:hypothetical protein GGF32_008367 [Allomyces javanicus]|nr:hypothetical protein GGF32_008367 [Allomyces javanicus]
MRSAHSSRSSSRSSTHSSLRRTKPGLKHRTASPAAVVVDDTDSSISLAASEIPSDTSIVLHNPPKIRSPARAHPTSAASILDRFRKPDKSPTPSVSTASRIASPSPTSVVPNEPSNDLVSDFSAFLNHMSDTSGAVQESVQSAVDKPSQEQSRSVVEILSSMRQPLHSSAIASSLPVSTRRSGASSVPSSRRSSGESVRGKQSSAVVSGISEEHSSAETSFGDVTSAIEEEGSDATLDPTAPNQYAPLIDMMQHLSTAMQTLSTPSPPRPSTADSGISAPAACACAHHDTARTHAFNQLLLAQVHLVQHLMSVAAPPGVAGGGFRYTTLEDTREYLRRHRRPPLSMDEALAQVRWEEERDVECARRSQSAAAKVKGRT